MKQNLLKEMEAGSKNALLKKRIITHYIYNGSSTITDLAKELDLSVPTTTKFINEMCVSGFSSGWKSPCALGFSSVWYFLLVPGFRQLVCWGADFISFQCMEFYPYRCNPGFLRPFPR